MLEAVIIIASVLIDRFTKIWAVNTLQNLPNMHTTLIPGVLDLRYVENTGAAFSMMRGMRWLFIPITMVIIAVLAFYLLRNRKQEKIYTRVALACVIGGALGNLIDRILYGYVVDMFEPTFMNFAVFNVADIFVTCGTAALVIIILFLSRDKIKTGDGPCNKESV